MEQHPTAAMLLLSAHHDAAQRLDGFPDGQRPETAEQAYAIQRLVTAAMGEIGGWKVGAAAAEDSAALGPFTCAPLPKAGVLPSPAAIGPDCTMRGLEAEIAVTMAASLPPRATPYTEAEVQAAIASAHPAIEVLQSRFADPAQVDRLSRLADGMGHFALVVGPAMPHWPHVDLARETVRVVVGGAEVKQRAGNPGGPMLPMLVWLANEGAAWAGGLRQGEVVTTGSWTGADHAQAGQTATARFEHMGSVEVSFA